MIWTLFIVCLLLNVFEGSSLQMGLCSAEQQFSIHDNSNYGCMLRPTLIDLRQFIFNLTEVVSVVPEMIEVLHCGGNCEEISNGKKCLPAVKRMKDVKVMYILGQTMNNINEQICGNITVEEHEACQCSCPLTLETCFLDSHGKIILNKDFDPDRCLCRCNNREDRQYCSRAGREWDEANCKCLCPSSSWHECSSGYVFDYEDSCVCIPTNMTASFGLVAASLTVMFCMIGTLLGLKSMREKKIGLFKHLRHNQVKGEEHDFSNERSIPSETTQLRSFK